MKTTQAQRDIVCPRCNGINLRRPDQCRGCKRRARVRAYIADGRTVTGRKLSAAS